MSSKRNRETSRDQDPELPPIETAPRSLALQRVPTAVRATLVVLSVALVTGLATLGVNATGLGVRASVIVALPAGVTIGFLVSLVMLLIPEWQAAADRRWLARQLAEVSRVDREQGFGALLMDDTSHELSDLARAMHEALLSAHKDRLEAAHLRRELDARVMRKTKTVVAELSKMSQTDELTGLLNRRGFDTGFADLFISASTANEEIALLAIDMDKFKQLNDTCGHASGDLALRAAGEVLQSQLRDGDLAGRIGGDEFMVALRGSGAKEALAVARRLGELFSKSIHASGFGDRWPSFSIGIACADEHEAPDAETLRRMADQALYAVKRRTRGTCIVFDPAHALESPSCRAA